MAARYTSWGRYPAARPRNVVPVAWQTDDPFSDGARNAVLAYGQGRSYGDTCLNNDGTLLDTRGLARFLKFDQDAGILRCEAGATLDEILTLIVPRGWFLPVTPGTKFVSVGGAIAHDVHGKNHHRAGTFGVHVTQFELLRSTGDRLLCSPAENTELYRATIGGLGLTGLIVWAEFRLRKIDNPLIAMERIRFGSLDEFAQLSRESDEAFEYTVAWLDCIAKGRQLGRGIFLRGNHAAAGIRAKGRSGTASLRIPCDAPSFVLNPVAMKAFNTLYFHAAVPKRKAALTHYDPFFYPLDRLLDWNRLYGKDGFLQYQCVVPFAERMEKVAQLLEQIATAGSGSFLAVLKTFGSVPSPGLMSFPRPGVTLALDFPFRGEPTLRLLEALDRSVAEAGGAVYPAKDARMSPASFRRFFPQYREFSKHLDPGFSSTFWQRVTIDENTAVPLAAP